MNAVRTDDKIVLFLSAVIEFYQWPVEILYTDYGVAESDRRVSQEDLTHSRICDTNCGKRELAEVYASEDFASRVGQRDCVDDPALVENGFHLVQLLESRHSVGGEQYAGAVSI